MKNKIIIVLVSIFSLNLVAIADEKKDLYKEYYFLLKINAFEDVEKLYNENKLSLKPIKNAFVTSYSDFMLNNDETAATKIENLANKLKLGFKKSCTVEESKKLRKIFPQDLDEISLYEKECNGGINRDYLFHLSIEDMGEVQGSGILSETPPSLIDYKNENYIVNMFYVKEVKTLAKDYVIKPHKSKIYDYQYAKGEQFDHEGDLLADGMFMMLYPKQKQKCLYKKIPLVAYVHGDNMFEFIFISEYQFVLKNYDDTFTLYEIQKPIYLSEYNSFLFNDTIECKNEKLQTKIYASHNIIHSVVNSK